MKLEVRAQEDVTTFFTKDGVFNTDVTTDPIIIYTPDLLNEVDIYAGPFSIVPWREKLMAIVPLMPMGQVLAGREGSIAIILKEINSRIEMSISDNGKEIKESEIPKIFDPFYTTKRNKGGTGLGLHIVYNIVTQLFKGTIQCSSVPGEGTTFTISFPAERIKPGN